MADSGYGVHLVTTVNVCSGSNVYAREKQDELEDEFADDDEFNEMREQRLVQMKKEYP